MAEISARVTLDGAVVPVLVGVGQYRRALLTRLRMHVPADIPLRLLLDTGSHITGFPTRVFDLLEVGSFGPLAIGTSSTRPGQPHFTGQYDISLTLVGGSESRHFPCVYAIASDDFGDDIQGILGRDVLDCCHLKYDGPGQVFRLTF